METKRASLQSRLQKREGKLSRWLGRVFVLLTLLGEATLPRFVVAHLDRALSRAAALVVELIFIRAMVRRNLRKPDPKSGQKPGDVARGFYDPRARRVKLTMRSAYGGALRRALGSGKKSLLARVEAIRRALKDQEQLIAKLARRLAKGLTRLGSAFTRALRVIASGAVAKMSGGALASLGLDSS